MRFAAMDASFWASAATRQAKLFLLTNTLSKNSKQNILRCILYLSTSIMYLSAFHV